MTPLVLSLFALLVADPKAPCAQMSLPGIGVAFVCQIPGGLPAPPNPVPEELKALAGPGIGTGAVPSIPPPLPLPPDEAPSTSPDHLFHL
jgi:hypothetical protein